MGTPVSISVKPVTVVVSTGHAMKFGRSITGDSGGGTMWSVVESGGGTVDGDGNYRAPIAPGVYHVRVVSKSDPAQSATATVTVVAPPDGTITASRAPGAEARVPSQPGCNFAWSITGGTLQSEGTSNSDRFIAGTGTKVTLTCKVTNAAGDSVTSSLVIPLAISVGIRPEIVTLTVGSGIKFGSSIQGGSSLLLLWNVEEPGGGRVDGAGNYTAPETPGTFTVRVMAKDDPSQSARAQVKVVSAPRGGIQASETVDAGAKELVASVPEQPGVAYAWTIEGGTITSGLSTHAVTFSAGSGLEVHLRCIMTNLAGDSFQTSRALRVTPSVGK